MTSFLSQENKQVIWEVLMRNDIVKSNNKTQMQNIEQMFAKVLQDFYLQEKNTNQPLIEQNKHFIRYFITFMNTLYNSQNTGYNSQNTGYNSQNALHQNANQTFIPITHEEREESRKKEFERNLVIKQAEFESFRKAKQPPIPSFQETTGEPINMEIMEVAWKQKLAEREKEYEQFSKTIPNPVSTSTPLIKPSIKYITIHNDTSLQEGSYSVIDLSKDTEVLPKDTEVLPKDNEVLPNKPNTNQPNKKIKWGENNTRMFTDDPHKELLQKIESHMEKTNELLQAIFQSMTQINKIEIKEQEYIS